MMTDDMFTRAEITVLRALGAACVVLATPFVAAVIAVTRAVSCG